MLDNNINWYPIVDITKEFKNPSTIFRSAPFWSWNGLITKDMIDEQLICFKKMGMGGFHIHVRVGLENEYLGDEFMELILYCNKKAKELDMYCYLYDEDRYASGFAGGLVTKTISYRSRHIVFSPVVIPEMEADFNIFNEKQMQNLRVKGCLLKEYDIILENGWLKSSRIISNSEEAIGKRWYAYLVLDKESGWRNHQTYVDTMNRSAITNFINITHEKYFKWVGEDFGKSIPSIFTDEPHVERITNLKYADDEEQIKLAYTDDFPQTFYKASGLDFFTILPELVWEAEGEEINKARYYYFDHVGERFADAFCDTIGNWCTQHGIMFTGHLLSEENLEGQLSCCGEAMRCYRKMHMPGMDLLCDRREFTTAKQVQSIVNQYGKAGMSSELYGVTQWDCDFKTYKLGGDWQAALGVTLRVHHLAWASMKGEAKRDYPAPIGWQSPWWEEYGYIEDYFGRINTTLTRGKNRTTIGVIHPIETMWLYRGTTEHTYAECIQLEEDFQNITTWLLTNQLDFDFVSESLLENDITATEDNTKYFSVGEMQYEVMILPSLVNLRENTFRRLMKFTKNSGKVIILGDKPKYVALEKSSELNAWLNDCVIIPFSKPKLLNALESSRYFEILKEDGTRSENYISQTRIDGDCIWLFLAKASSEKEDQANYSDWIKKPMHEAEKLTISLKGIYKAEHYNAINGEITDINIWYKNNKTYFNNEFFGNDSLLVRFTPGKSKAISKIRTIIKRKEIKVPDVAKIVLDAPNALLLDRFSYSLNNGKCSEKEEILKIDCDVRNKLGYALRAERSAQPYVDKEDVRKHELALFCEIESDIELTGCCLAMEDADYAQIFWNDKPIQKKECGYYVDKAIRKFSLPALKKGSNMLKVVYAYGKKSNPERMYLLGDFSVLVQGSYSKIIERQRIIRWGDFTVQGYPFYTDNMGYEFTIHTESAQAELHISYYSGSLLKVVVNDENGEVFPYLPHSVTLRNLKKGRNKICIICYGHRYNGFGQVHMIGDDLIWQGPESWRTEGNSWADEYQLKKMGILAKPQIWVNESTESVIDAECFQ